MKTEITTKESIQQLTQKQHEHYSQLKQIALKLLEQLKSENVSFGDADQIINLLSISVKTERDQRVL